MNDRVAIIGVGRAGYAIRTPDSSYKELIYSAAVRAYDDAGVDPRRDIQSFITVAEDFHEGTSIFDEYTPDQLGAALRPVQTIAGDGLHGLATAFMLMKTGQADIVAVEGHSKASNILTLDEITNYAQDPILNRPLRFNSHFIAGMDMNRYLYETGTTREQCARVVQKNRSNALKNPSAPFGAILEIEQVLSPPVLAYPLTAHQKADHSDGAIVMVLATEKVALKLSEKPIWMLGIGWCNDSPSLEYREWGRSIYTEKSAQMAYRLAGIRDPLKTIDFAEIDDTYAFKELQAMEALGFCRSGEAGILLEQGFTEKDGDLPINVSGGSLGMGNLLDANGLARALEVVYQLRGEAGQYQIPDVEIGLAQSWRGVPANSGAVAIFSN